MSGTNQNNDSRILKTYMPAGALLLLTVAVMLYFKNTQDSGFNVFDHGGSLLERFYTKNLSPLFQSKNELSNEDLVNFAFNNNLPISDEKILYISENSENGQELGVKDALVKRETNNYQKFIDRFCNNDESRARVDSILDSYRDELTASILISENQAYAIDPGIIELNNALKAELLECAKNSPIVTAYNLEKNKLYHLDKEKIFKYRDEVLKNQERELVFLTPDTVFTKEYKFDRDKIVQALEIPRTDDWDKNFSEIIIPVAPLEVPKPRESEFRINDYEIDKKRISAKYMTKHKEILSMRDSLLKISYAIKEEFDKKKLGKMSFEFGADSENVHFEFNFDELGDFIFQTLNAVGEQSAKNWEQFGLKMDSAAQVFEQSVIDSLIKTSIIKKNQFEKKKKIRKKSKKSE